MGKKDGELIPCRLFCSEEEEARNFSLQKTRREVGEEIQPDIPFILLP
jgi:hypothetical protein